MPIQFQLLARTLYVLTAKNITNVCGVSLYYIYICINSNDSITICISNATKSKGKYIGKKYEYINKFYKRQFHAILTM